jgi:hypothetical protein
MKRNVLFAFGLLIALASFGFFGVAWAMGRVTDDLTHTLGATFFAGLLFSALMTDPKSLLALVDRVLAFKFGKKSDGGN